MISHAMSSNRTPPLCFEVLLSSLVWLGTHSVAQADLELAIFLPHPPEYRDSWDIPAGSVLLLTFKISAV